jgi:hypothetical protein
MEEIVINPLVFHNIQVVNKLIQLRKKVRTMCEVIEFKSKKDKLLEKKYARFDELKIKDFSGILTPTEEKEYNDLDEWLEIHIRSKRNNKNRMAN